MTDCSRFRHWLGWVWVAAALAAAIVRPSSLTGQEAKSRDGGFPPADHDVVAVVDGFEIRAGYVSRNLTNANPQFLSGVLEEVTPQIWAAAVEHLIQRQSVLGGLRDGPAAIGPSELKLELDQICKRLESAGTSLDQHIERLGWTKTEFENELLWRLTWNRFLEHALTDEAVEEYFRQHHADFDGTQLLVDQVLWVFQADPTSEQKQALRQQAEEVFTKLRDGSLTWNDAVKQFSMSPLAGDADRSGRLIGRNAPMPRGFSDAAFVLKAGEISPPVETLIGLHIIRCLEVRAGNRLLEEVSTQVRSAMTTRLFEHLVSRHRESALVEHRPGFPHINETGVFQDR